MHSSVIESVRKQSLLLKLDLNIPKIDKNTGKEEDRPQLFTDSYLDNPPNYFYVKLARENRRNDFDLTHGSHLMLPYALRSDRLYSCKIGVKKNQIFEENSLANTLSVHASTKLQTNYNDLHCWKSNLFSRWMYTWNAFQFTGTVSAGINKNLTRA